MTSKQLESVFESLDWENKNIQSAHLPEFHVIWHTGDSCAECVKYFATHKEIGIDVNGFDVWRSAYLFQDDGGAKIGVTQSSNEDDV